MQTYLSEKVSVAVEKARSDGCGMSRRIFVGSLGAAVVAPWLSSSRVGQAAGFPQPTAPPPASPSLQDYFRCEEKYFGWLSKKFLVDQKPPYFAVGQKGSMPLSVLNRLHEGIDQIARDPFPVYLEPSAETRGKIARSYGATVGEIAISRNTTDAISQILSGIDWQPGDELLASTMEYPNCVATLLRVVGRWGLTLRQFGIPMTLDATAEEVVASLERQIHPGRTKVIFFSCPIQPVGQLMPARRIARLAQQYGITTVVDGAHYGGQFVPELAETGIDFFGISGHKWQCGPGGTGILYVRNTVRPSNPTPLPRFHLIRSGDLEAPTDGSRPDDFDIGAALSLYGFPESADWRALGEVCELWDSIGRQRIEDYILALGDYFRQRIMNVFGDPALMQAVNDPELKSGIVAFNPFPTPAQRRDADLGNLFASRLYDEYGYRIGHGGLGPSGLTRPPDPEAQAFPEGCIPNRDPVTNAPAPTEFPMRANAFIWLTRADIDDFVASCADLVSRMI